MAVIRPPVMADYEQLNALGRWFQQESAYRNCGWSDTKFAKILHAAMLPGSIYFLRVAEEDGAVTGMFLGFITEYFFSEKRLAMEQVVCFAPDRRKHIGKSLIKMFREFESWAKEKDAVEVCIGVTYGMEGAGYEKFLERVGYKLAGSFFKREV